MKKFQPMKLLHLDFRGKFPLRGNSLFIDKISEKSIYRRKHENKIKANKTEIKSRTK